MGVAAIRLVLMPCNHMWAATDQIEAVIHYRSLLGLGERVCSSLTGKFVESLHSVPSSTSNMTASFLRAMNRDVFTVPSDTSIT